MIEKLKPLKAKGKLNGLAIPALKAIGKDQLSETVVNKFIEILQQEDNAKLIHDRDLAPAWIAKIFDRALKHKNDGD